MHSLKRPLFSVGIHLNSDSGTRSQRGQNQFERFRPRILATVLARFVRLKPMRPGGYVLDKSQRSGIYGYISRHISRHIVSFRIATFFITEWPFGPFTCGAVSVPYMLIWQSNRMSGYPELSILLSVDHRTVHVEFCRVY